MNLEGRCCAVAITLALFGAHTGASAQSTATPPQPVTATPAGTASPAAAPKTWKAPAKKEPPPPPLPDTPARMWLIAPGPHEAWTLRIDNEGERGIRIPADIRLLKIEIEVPSNDPKNPKKKPATFKCALPDSMRPSGFPEKRGLLLAPGQSYIETFDPRLFCFGKNADGLVGTAIVRARFGWDPPPKWSIAAKKPPAPPFAAESTDNPSTTAPLRELAAPTIVLSFGTPPSPPPAASTGPAAPMTAMPAASGTATPAASASAAPTASAMASAAPTASATARAAPTASAAATAAPSATGTPKAAPPVVVDAKAPRLAVSSPGFQDASAPRSASVTVTVKNAGARPMTAVMRQRMLALEIIGPDRTVVCPASAPTHAIPRDAFREYKPDGSSSFTVLLKEVCPDNLFSRPGLYLVHAAFWANEPGAQYNLDAFTGRATAAAPTVLRLQTSSEPFYRDAPKAVPTPKPEVPADDSEPAP